MLAELFHTHSLGPVLQSIHSYVCLLPNQTQNTIKLLAARVWRWYKEEKETVENRTPLISLLVSGIEVK